MRPGKMHTDEIDINPALVRALLAAQFSRWSGLSLAAVPSSGTVNAVYRLGDELCLRLPRLARWADGLQKELRWLPLIADHVSLAVPEPLAAGKPGPGYPLPWAVYRWLAGEPFNKTDLLDECAVAESLARFVMELRALDPAGGPRSTRDRPLHLRNAESRAAIRATAGLIDTASASAAWEESLRAPEWDGAAIWTHGDLLPSNLLVAQGQLSAVIDFGNMGVGDPAVDLIAAWAVFGRDGRRVFRSALGVDEGTWARSRGLALHQALLIIPYYRRTNPEFAAAAMRTVAEVAADYRGEV